MQRGAFRRDGPDAKIVMIDVEQILVDIDTQRDFMLPGGALYVPGAEQIIPNLVRLFDHALAARIPVLSSADRHGKDDPEFEQFPPHCVAGTDGQAKLPETLMSRYLAVEPDQEIDEPERVLGSYEQIVFNKTLFDVWSNAGAVSLIESIRADEFTVFGVATDYCVRSAGLGLLQRGCRVRVVGDAVRPVSEETGRIAEEELRSAGARWVTTDEVIGGRR